MILDEYKRYSLDNMNKALYIKSVLRSTLYNNDKYMKPIEEDSPLSLLYRRLLKCSVDGKALFNPDKSCIEWSDVEGAYVMNFSLEEPFPDDDTLCRIEEEIKSKFMGFYTYGDYKMLCNAGLNPEQLVFVSHNPTALSFLYNIFNIGTNIIIQV